MAKKKVFFKHHKGKLNDIKTHTLPLNKHMIDVSITTINYNISDKLQKCIDSFLSTYVDLNYEWFIFDNNSDDMDFDLIIRKYSNNKRIKFIKNDKNEGLTVLNKIIDRVNGRYWVFLDPDTLQKVKPIEELIEFMDSNSHAGMATVKQFNLDGSPLLYYSRRWNFTRFFFRWTMIGRLIDHLLFSNKMKNYYSFSSIDFNKINEIEQAVFACTIIRKELVFEDGYVIDPQLSFWYNDVDLCKRVRDKGYKIYLVPSAHIIHDHGSAYKIRKPLWLWMIRQKCQIKYFRKHYKYMLLFLKLSLFLEILVLIMKNKLKNKSNKVLFWKFRNILKW